MMTLDELKSRLGEVRDESLSLEDFEEWFRTNSRGAYASSDKSLSDVAASVEAAFSKQYFEAATEDQLRGHLVALIAPSLQHNYQPRFHSAVFPSLGSNATESAFSDAIQNAA